MNFEKCINALYESKGSTYTLKEALECPTRWGAYWRLYSTNEAKSLSIGYDEWIRYVDFVRSKPE